MFVSLGVAHPNRIRCSSRNREILPNLLCFLPSTILKKAANYFLSAVRSSLKKCRKTPLKEAASPRIFVFFIGIKNQRRRALPAFAPIAIVLSPLRLSALTSFTQHMRCTSDFSLRKSPFR